MPAPTQALSELRRDRFSQRSQIATVSAVATPVLTPPSRTPSTYGAEPSIKSVSPIDVLPSRPITEGLKRLKTLESALESLGRRAVATDQAQSSALAGLDGRPSRLEQSYTEQHLVNGLSKSSDVAKMRCSESLDAKAARQNICQIPERASRRASGQDEGVLQSIIETKIPRVSPMFVDRMAWSRSKEGKREAQKRYTIRRRPTR